MTSPIVIHADVTELPALQNLRRYHGDSWTIVLQLNDDAATRHDLTGATVTAAARSTTTSAAVILLSASAGDDPTAGTVTVGPPSGGLQAGLYAYDVEVADGASTITWVRGELAIEGDVAP